MSKTLEIDVFWSFRSPWSYLATPRLHEWTRLYDLRVHFRPVYPIAIRTPDFFDRIHPLWRPYFMVDLRRVAEFLDVPIEWPDPDPVNQIMTDEGRMKTAEDQPYIHRLTRLGVLAEERGQGLDFAFEVSNLIWSGVAWNTGSHLAEATARADLHLDELDPLAESEADRLDTSIDVNQTGLEAAGHWGVPTCAFRGEPFFGQDRLDVLLWRLKQNGLSERARPDADS